VGTSAQVASESRETVRTQPVISAAAAPVGLHQAHEAAGGRDPGAVLRPSVLSLHSLGAAARRHLQQQTG
jgi:hypothetical protein